MSCYSTDRRCPECGSPLLTNGRVVWCSLVGSDRPDGPRAPGCAYGIRERVKVEDAPGPSGVVIPKAVRRMWHALDQDPEIN